MTQAPPAREPNWVKGFLDDECAPSVTDASTHASSSDFRAPRNLSSISDVNERGQGCFSDLTSVTRSPNQAEVFYADDTGTGNFVGTVANLVNSAIGAGMLALPKAYQCTGAVLGSLLLLVFALIVLHSLHIIGRAQKFANAKTYQESVKKLIGPRGELCIIIFQLVFLVGACVGFLDIICDQGIGELKAVIHNEFLISREFVLGFVCVVVLMPLMFVRNMQTLWPLAMFSVLAVCYTTCLIVKCCFTKLMHHKPLEVVMGEPHPTLGSQVSLFRQSTDIFRAIPIFVFAYNIHTTYPIVFGELAARRLSRMDRATFVSILVCFLVYVSCGLAGLLYGVASKYDAIPGDVLLMFPQSTDVSIGRWCIFASVVASYTSCHFSARVCIQDLLRAYGLVGPEGFSDKQYATEIVLFLLGTAAVAMEVTQLDLVLGIVGCVACMPFMFMFPGLLQVKMDAASDVWSLKSREKGYVLIIFGAVMSFVGLVVTFSPQKAK